MSIVSTSTSIPLIAEIARAPLVRTPGADNSSMTCLLTRISLKFFRHVGA